MKKVLVAVDFSDVTKRVMKNAIKIAKSMDSELKIIHTDLIEPFLYLYGMNTGFDNPGFVVDTEMQKNSIELQKKRNEAALDVIKLQLREVNLEANCELLEGPTVETILDVAKSYQADLIIIGTHEHGKLYHLIFGNTAESLISQSNCPILVVP